MKQTEPSLEEWSKLYEVAIKVRDMAPWQWMWEAEVFGIQHPETGQMGFISLMGRGGEHFAVALYLESAGLHGFLEIEQAASSDRPFCVYEVPQLQASFEDRAELDKRDLGVIKELGLKFRGKNKWPMFRSIRPGYFPWNIDAAECRFLTVALEQTLLFAPRFKEDPALFRPDGDGRWLVRVPARTESGILWSERRMHVLPPPTPDVEIEAALVDELENVPEVSNVIEIDFFSVDSPIKDPDSGRPCMPYCLMMVESQSGFVLDTDMQLPNPSIEAMRAKVPGRIAEKFLRLNVLPQTVMVRSGTAEQLVRAFAEPLDIRVLASHTLRSLDRAKRSLISHMSGW